MYVKLRKEVGQSGVGPYWWENDGDVVEVPVDMAEELLGLKTAGFTLIPDNVTPSFIPDNVTPFVDEASIESVEAPLVDDGEPAVDDSYDVPEGSAEQVIAWVNGDKGRARAALNAERAKGAWSRVTLLAKLEKLI